MSAEKKPPVFVAWYTYMYTEVCGVHHVFGSGKYQHGGKENTSDLPLYMSVANARETAFLIVRRQGRA